MFRIEINNECEVQVIVNFEEMAEYNSDCIDNCVEAIYSITKNFKEITKDNIDEPQDYYFTIECIDENQASNVEDFLNSSFEELEIEFC